MSVEVQRRMFNSTIEEWGGVQDTFSAHRAIQRAIGYYGRKSVSKGTLTGTIWGRPACDDCLIDIPRLADYYNVPRALYYDMERRQLLFWKKGMAHYMVPLGQKQPLIETAVGAVGKTTAVGGSQSRNFKGEE